MITVVEGPEWGRIKRQLLKEQKTLDGRFHRAQRRVLEEKVRQAQAWVIRGPISGGPAKHTGLRRKVASSVTTLNKGGVSDVAVVMTDRSLRNMPANLDSVDGWAHPLFGDNKHWYRERAEKPGWFTRTFSDAGSDVADALFNELQAASKRIDQSS